MRIPSSMIRMLLASVMVLGVGLISGQDYPNKPIRIVTAGVGGGGDFAARLIAQGLALSSLGQAPIVDNRGGMIPFETVSKSPPDGYTLLFHASALWLSPFMRDSVVYDPVRDFAPISLTTRAPNILVVHPSLPVRSVKEFIVLAKARPGQLNYTATSLGGSSNLAAQLFKVMAGVDIVRVNYKSGSQEIADLTSGQVQLTFGTPGTVASHVKSGRLRPLAVSTAQPSQLFPNLPTIAASGLPGYESASIQGMFAPAKTPATIITRLNQEIVRVLNSADVKEKFFNTGVETVGSSPEELGATVRSEMAKWGKIIKDAGIREE